MNLLEIVKDELESSTIQEVLLINDALLEFCEFTNLSIDEVRINALRLKIYLDSNSDLLLDSKSNKIDSLVSYLIDRGTKNRDSENCDNNSELFNIPAQSSESSKCEIRGFDVELEEGNYDVSWYIFMAKSRVYLAGNRDSKEGISVYEMCKDRRWRALHNGSSFDGFDCAANFFRSVSISEDGRSVKITE